jgi:tetratricopeptide (TPR) repeat protein
VSVPAAERASVVAFVRGGQPQSQELLKLLSPIAKDAPRDVQVIIVLGGDSAADQARLLADDRTNPPWPIVVDTQFAASGEFNVHVWPTTVIVDSAGAEVAHVAGLPQSGAADLQAYLDFATHKMDKAALNQRLTKHDVVADNAEQAAARHLQVARQLMDGRQLEDARAQVEQGLKLKPDEVALRLTLARIMLMQNQPREALGVLNATPSGAAPVWQVGTLRGRALIATERWDEAAKILTDCINLNPEPAEAHYLLGLVYQHNSDWPRAAECFRKAFEASPPGQRAAMK